MTMIQRNSDDVQTETKFAVVSLIQPTTAIVRLRREKKEKKKKKRKKKEKWFVSVMGHFNKLKDHPPRRFAQQAGPS